MAGQFGSTVKLIQRGETSAGTTGSFTKEVTLPIPVDPAKTTITFIGITGHYEASSKAMLSATTLAIVGRTYSSATALISWEIKEEY